MIEFNSKIKLNNFVPVTEEEKIVIFKSGMYNPRIFYWDECWIEKKYWTIPDAAKYLEVTEQTIIDTLKQYSYYLKMHRIKYGIKMRYATLLRLKHIIDHKNNLNLKQLSHAFTINQEPTIV